MAYTSEEIRAMETQYELVTQTINKLRADQRKLREILRQRKLYEKRIGHKVEDKKKYSKMSCDEKKEYHAAKQKEYRKRDRDNKTIQKVKHNSLCETETYIKTYEGSESKRGDK